MPSSKGPFKDLSCSVSCLNPGWNQRGRSKERLLLTLTARPRSCGYTHRSIATRTRRTRQMRERWRSLLGIPYCAADLVRHLLIDMGERAFVPLARAFQIILCSVIAGEALRFFVPPGDRLPLLGGALFFPPPLPDFRDELRPLPSLPLPRPGDRPRD